MPKVLDKSTSVHTLLMVSFPPHPQKSYAFMQLKQLEIVVTRIWMQLKHIFIHP